MQSSKRMNAGSLSIVIHMVALVVLLTSCGGTSAPASEATSAPAAATSAPATATEAPAATPAAAATAATAAAATPAQPAGTPTPEPTNIVTAKGSGSGPLAGIELNVLTFTGPQIAEPLQRHAKEFAANTGATVHVTTVPFSDLYQTILTDLSTGTHSFDVFVFDP